MFMPLLVRLIDSEVEVIDGAVPQVSDCIEDGSSILEEVSSSRLSIDEQVLLPDLHIDPIHGNSQPDGELRGAEQACLMGPPGARLGHPNSGAAPDLTHRDRKDHVLAVRGGMPLAGEGRGDFVIGKAIAGKIEHTITHFCPSRELEDGVDSQFDFEIGHSAAPPDDPDLSDIVLTAVEHNFVNKTPQ